MLVQPSFPNRYSGDTNWCHLLRMPGKARETPPLDQSARSPGPPRAVTHRTLRHPLGARTVLPQTQKPPPRPRQLKRADARNRRAGSTRAAHGGGRHCPSACCGAERGRRGDEENQLRQSARRHRGAVPRDELGSDLIDADARAEWTRRVLTELAVTALITPSIPAAASTACACRRRTGRKSASRPRSRW